MVDSVDKPLAAFDAGEVQLVLGTPPGRGSTFCYSGRCVAAVCLDARLHRLATNVERLAREFEAQGTRLSALEGQMAALEDTSERLSCTERESRRQIGDLET